MQHMYHISYTQQCSVLSHFWNLISNGRLTELTAGMYDAAAASLALSVWWQDSQGTATLQQCGTLITHSTSFWKCQLSATWRRRRLESQTVISSLAVAHGSITQCFAASANTHISQQTKLQLCTTHYLHPATLKSIDYNVAMTFILNNNTKN